MPRLSDARRRWEQATDEPVLKDFWDAYDDQRAAGPWRFVLGHPVASLTAVTAALRLPRLAYRLGDDSPEERFVRGVLGQVGVGPVRAGGIGVAILELPDDPRAYRRGPHRATLRRKARKAAQQGVTCRRVTDPGERRELLARAQAAEAKHPDERFRTDRPDNADLLDFDTWLVAETGGEPVLLSVTPIAGEWAALRYFRTLGWDRVHGDARYLATQALAEHLSGRGVRYLLDTEHPGRQAPGVRHFQRMVGFRFRRVRVTGRL